MTLIISPSAFKNTTVTPDHFTLAFSFPLAEFSYVLAYLKFNTIGSGNQWIFVLNLAKTIWFSIFIHSKKFIAIHELNAACVL